MNDAAVVGGGECVGDLQADQQRGFQLQWTAATSWRTFLPSTYCIAMK